MPPFIRACRDALHRAGYILQEQPRFPHGFQVSGTRASGSGEASNIFAFGITAEEAYVRACMCARISVPSLLDMGEDGNGR